METAMPAKHRNRKSRWFGALGIIFVILLTIRIILPYFKVCQWICLLEGNYHAITFQKMEDMLKISVYQNIKSVLNEQTNVKFLFRS